MQRTDTSNIDRILAAQAKSQIEGSARIQVDVRAPKGTSVKADADGMFKQVELNRSMQMPMSIDGTDWGAG